MFKQLTERGELLYPEKKPGPRCSAVAADSEGYLKLAKSKSNHYRASSNTDCRQLDYFAGTKGILTIQFKFQM